MPDAARAWTDAELEKLERRIASEYSQAAKEMREKQKKWLASFEREREMREKALDSTKEAMEAHKRWLASQASRGQWIGGMADQLAQSATQANQKAAAALNGHLPYIFSENANRAAFSVDKAIRADTSFTLANENAVRYLMGLDESKPLIHEVIDIGPTQYAMRGGEARKLQSLVKNIDVTRDIQWNRQKFTSAITQGIMQGESIPDIVKRTESIYGMNRVAATRAVRTAVTAAENAGKKMSYERAAELGIDIEITWSAVHDERTRVSHRELDGEKIHIGETFSNGLEYPGDPAGEPAETYNCRCDYEGKVVGFDGIRGDWDDEGRERWTRLPEDMTYEEWKAAKPKTRAESYANDSRRVSAAWHGNRAADAAMVAADAVSAMAGPERIAELEQAAADYDAEVERLSRQSYVPSEASVNDIQRYVDKYAAQMAENEWAKDLEIDALRAESDRLYAEQAKVWERYDAAKLRKRELLMHEERTEAWWAEYDKAGAEVDKLFSEYEAYFGRIDEVDRKIDALRDYERAEARYREYSAHLAERKAARETALAERAENERLLAEARRNRNRAYGELSDAQPFAPHVRAALGDEYADAMEAIVAAAEGEHPEIAAAYRRFSSQLRIAAADAESETAYYSSRARGIFFNAREAAVGSYYEEPYETAFHEFAHLIDHNSGYGGTKYTSRFSGLTEVVKSDWKAYRNEAGRRLGVTRNKNQAAIQELLDHGAKFDKKKYGNVSDAIEGCTGESYPLGVGHGASYHRSYDGATGVEFFAEVFDSAMTNQAAYDEMKRIFPNAVRMVEDMAREMCS